LAIYIASPEKKRADYNLSAGIGPETWPSNQPPAPVGIGNWIGIVLLQSFSKDGSIL
jgi:hypothetical protein